MAAIYFQAINKERVKQPILPKTNDNKFAV